MRFKFGSINKITRHACAAGALLLATAVYPQTFGQEGQMRAVVTTNDAYIPAPARLVAAGRVDDVAPDPRGRYVLVSRRDPAPLIVATDVTALTTTGRVASGSGVSLLLYDSQTGRVRTVWEQPAPDEANPVQGSVIALKWFPGSDTALAVVSIEQISETVAPIDALPTRSTAARPPDINPLKRVSGVLVAPPPGAAGQQPAAKVAQFAPLWVVRADGKREGRLPTATVIAPDAQESFLLADDSAVLYIADHTVYAVSLTSQRRPEFDATYRAILQKQTMANAKQLGLAILAYTQDYDDKYPPAADVATSIGPYVKNANIFNDPDTDTPAFTYLLGGLGLASMSAPATTPMGYLAGPGGRAVVYADGHVVWEGSE